MVFIGLPWAGIGLADVRCAAPPGPGSRTPRLTGERYANGAGPSFVVPGHPSQACRSAVTRMASPHALAQLMIAIWKRVPRSTLDLSRLP